MHHPAGSDASNCTALNSALDDRRRDQNLAVAGFIGAGVGAAALVATAFLWKPATNTETGPAVAPVVGPREAGIAVRWRY